MNKKNNNLLRLLNMIIQKNKIKLILSFMMVFIISIIDLLKPQVTKLIIDDAIGNKNIELLIKMVILYSSIVISSGIIEVILSYIYASIQKKVTINLKVQLLNNISKLSGKYFSSIKTGNILSIIESDMFMIEAFGAELIFTMIVNIFTAFLSLFFLIRMQPDLFLIVCFLQIILTIAQNKITKLISKRTIEIRSDAGSISNIVQEYVSNIMNVVLSKSRGKFFKSYLNKEKKLINKYLKLDLIMSGNIAISQILSGFITVSIYGFGGYKIVKGYMSIGELIAFQQYTGMLIGPCISIIRANTRIGQARASIDRVFSIIDEEIDIKVDNRGYKVNKNKCNSIEFKNVCFKYDEEGSFILNKINLEFKKGNTTAIVGRSGCGKSTIANLIYRLWDVNKGDILIDGISIKETNLKSLRKNISIVTQDLLIFNDTIKNNIKLNNDISDEKLEKIIELVGLNDLIDNLDNGLEELVGEKGIKISGGQKQRIAIARSLISDSKILILDEATSALDNISQNKLLSNINKYVKDKIVIVIAHRLSTIKDADIIYVLDKGEVVEYGDDESLISNNGLYKMLVMSTT